MEWIIPAGGVAAVVANCLWQGPGKNVRIVRNQARDDENSNNEDDPFFTLVSWDLNMSFHTSEDVASILKEINADVAVLQSVQVEDAERIAAKCEYGTVVVQDIAMSIGTVLLSRVPLEPGSPAVEHVELPYRKWWTWLTEGPNEAMVVHLGEGIGPIVAVHIGAADKEAREACVEALNKEQPDTIWAGNFGWGSKKENSYRKVLEYHSTMEGLHARASFGDKWSDWIFTPKEKRVAIAYEVKEDCLLDLLGHAPVLAKISRGPRRRHSPCTSSDAS
jgi:hypothetical protein